MINVVFSPGTYGHYFSSCIHFYSDISSIDNFPNFGVHGDSHEFNKSIVYPTHEAITDKTVDNFVFIEPRKNHELDYKDNQLEKAHGRDLKKYLKSLSLYKNIPTNWETREDISFWIEDLLENSYQSFLKTIDRKCIIVDVNSIFDNLLDTLDDVLLKLSLTRTTDSTIIMTRHQQFLKLQKNHNIQLRIANWVNNIINGVECKSPCNTILDEAYAQHLLRMKGYELRCYNLDVFPSNSLQLRSLIS
jgi:hypothetical protein